MTTKAKARTTPSPKVGAYSDDLDGLRRLAQDPEVQARFDNLIETAFQDLGIPGHFTPKNIDRLDDAMMLDGVEWARTGYFLIAARKALREKVGLPASRQ